MKNELRKIYKKLRLENECCDNIFEKKVEELVEKYSNIALYKALQGEPNLDCLFNRLLLTKNIYLPVVEELLYFKEFKSIKDLKKDSKGILSPIDGNDIKIDNIEVIVIPCIAANTKGYRIGYGGGYYDRAIQYYRGIKIGLVYDNCITEINFQNEFDVRLDIIVTQTKVIKT